MCHALCNFVNSWVSPLSPVCLARSSFIYTKHSSRTRRYACIVLKGTQDIRLFVLVRRTGAGSVKSSTITTTVYCCTSTNIQYWLQASNGPIEGNYYATAVVISTSICVTCSNLTLWHQRHHSITIHYTLYTIPSGINEQ